MLKINSVVVIGATGAVGKTVSGIFASFGDAKVYMVGRDVSKLEKAKRDAVLSVKSIIVEDNLIVKSMDELEECILDADFIFESVSENMDTKKEIHMRINNIVKKETIIATGTSGLSIDELSECYDEHKRSNFFGVHFFNPPYSMPLCELIPSKYNEGNKELTNSLKEYLCEKLYRDVVIVKNEPAFLANMTVDDIDFFETHDCFTSSEYMAISAFDITEPGKEYEAVENGTIDFNGSKPINPSGGLIGCGHPVGTSGVRMMLDLYKQVTNNAGDYQVKNAKNGMMLNLGGSASTNYCFIVGKKD